MGLLLQGAINRRLSTNRSRPTQTQRSRGVKSLRSHRERNQKDHIPKVVAQSTKQRLPLVMQHLVRHQDSINKNNGRTIKKGRDLIRSTVVVVVGTSSSNNQDRCSSRIKQICSKWMYQSSKIFYARSYLSKVSTYLNSQEARTSLNCSLANWDKLSHQQRVVNSSRTRASKTEEDSKAAIEVAIPTITTITNFIKVHPHQPQPNHSLQLP